jgi:hypothetical protein
VDFHPTPTYFNNNDEKNSGISDFERYQKTSIGRTSMEHISQMEEAFGSYSKRHDASQIKLKSLMASYPTVNIWLLHSCREHAQTRRECLSCKVYLRGLCSDSSTIVFPFLSLQNAHRSYIRIAQPLLRYRGM